MKLHGLENYYYSLFFAYNETQEISWLQKINKKTFFVWFKTSCNFMILKIYDSNMFILDMKNNINIMISENYYWRMFLNKRNRWNFMISKDHQNYLFFCMLKDLLKFHELKIYQNYKLFKYKLTHVILWFCRIIKTYVFKYN